MFSFRYCVCKVWISRFLVYFSFSFFALFSFRTNLDRDRLPLSRISWGFFFFPFQHQAEERFSGLNVNRWNPGVPNPPQETQYRIILLTTTTHTRTQALDPIELEEGNIRGKYIYKFSTWRHTTMKNENLFYQQRKVTAKIDTRCCNDFWGRVQV